MGALRSATDTRSKESVSRVCGWFCLGGDAMSRKRPHHGSRRRGTHPKPRKQRVLLEGTLQILRPGMAQVHTSEGTFAVARRGVREGMNGDVVQISLIPMHGRRGEPVAYVQGVLQRASSTLLGIYGFADPLGVVTPLDSRLVHDFFVLPEDNCASRLGIREGDVVSARIIEYPTRQSAGVATIERRLGSAEELDVNIEAVIASYGLATEFLSATVSEAEGIVADVAAALARDDLRRDLREELCVTVDPTDARDFDDAVGAWRLAGGGYGVHVHIADVTNYVSWSSSIDAEARQRTCSVYLADRVIPMLPERLCNDVCSLRPNEDRLAMTVCLELDANGGVIGAEAFPSAIRSRARLSYDEVDKLLEGTCDAQSLPCSPGTHEDVAATLAVLDEVARLREKMRRQRGSIDFFSVESKVVLDGEGKPLDILVRRRTRATSLVEEAMLMANEAVAKMLAERDVATAYRVHERPAPADLIDVVGVLRELGLVSNEEAGRVVEGSPHALQTVLGKAAGTNNEYLVNTLLLRAQKRAIYLPHNDGHYALGAKAYCHFTSPIRRYPDVLVHRALKALLYGGKPMPWQRQTERALPQLCATCSERERVADAAARASEHVKMAELYAGRIGMSYSGIVVGCERFGLFVMLDDTCVQGFVPVRALGDEWFSYDQKRLSLTGESSGRIWRVGQRVAVSVAEVDVPKGRIDFALAGNKRQNP